MKLAHTYAFSMKLELNGGSNAAEMVRSVLRDPALAASVKVEPVEHLRESLQHCALAVALGDDQPTAGYWMF
jgi:hypothetical protein